MSAQKSLLDTFLGMVRFLFEVIPGTRARKSLLDEFLGAVGPNDRARFTDHLRTASGNNVILASFDNTQNFRSALRYLSDLADRNDGRVAAVPAQKGGVICIRVTFHSADEVGEFMAVLHHWTEHAWMD